MTEKKYDSFKEVERIGLKLEEGGELIISLKTNEVRTYKIEFYLNGSLIKPENFGGKQLAYKRWASLIRELVENRDDYQPLTPE